jgi:2-dehydro-3-deoxygluconokinase
MADLKIKPAEKCRYDAVSLGEVMMRIDPGDVPTARARAARIWHGGGETNVAEGLSYCFGLRTAVVTALVDDGIGRNIENQMREAGVDTSHIVWFSTNGKGKFSTDQKGTLHNGINFTWSGKGVLPSVTEYYRAHTAIRELKPGDVDWKALFGQGVRWFHTGRSSARASAGSTRAASTPSSPRLRARRRSRPWRRREKRARSGRSISTTAPRWSPTRTAHGHRTRRSSS